MKKHNSISKAEVVFATLLAILLVARFITEHLFHSMLFSSTQFAYVITAVSITYIVIRIRNMYLKRSNKNTQQI